MSTTTTPPQAAAFLVGCLFINLLSTAPAATAMYYPRPVDEASRVAAAAQWEPVQDFRDRWQIPFDYKPVALHPEDCRYKTEEECQDADLIKLEYIEKQRRRAQSAIALGEVANRPPLPPQPHALVLLMRFTDHVDRVLPTQAQHENLWGVLINDWLDTQSYGKHSPSFDVIDWMDTDNTESYYSFGDYGRQDGFESSIHFLLNQLDADPDFDMSIYDTDGDGEVDNLIVLHSGYNSESFKLDCQSQRAPEFGIWSHWRFAPDGWVSPTTGLAVSRYMVTSALDEDCGSVPANMGIMAMNYMHSLGSDSLYDQGNGIGNGIGKFDIMAYPYGNNNGGRPGSLSSFSKMQLEWITPVDVEENSYFQLRPWGQQPDAIMISKKYSPGEYLLLENRQPVGVDDGFVGAGVAIFHVDDQQDGQSAVSYPGKEDYPLDHYMVAVLAKDGKYDLEKGNNQGDTGDLWKVGDTLGPGMGDTVFPNTDGYQFGYVWENGLTIKIISECGNPNKGRHMVVQIGGFGDAEPTGSPECVVVEEDTSANVDLPPRPEPTRPPTTSRPTNERPPRPSGRPTDAPAASPGLEGVTAAPTPSLGANVVTMAPTESSGFGLGGTTMAPTTGAQTQPASGEEEIVTMSPTMMASNVQETFSPSGGVLANSGEVIPDDFAPIPTSGPTTAPSVAVAGTIDSPTTGITTGVPTNTPSLAPSTSEVSNFDPASPSPPPSSGPTSASTAAPTKAINDFSDGAIDGATATDEENEGYDGPGGSITAPNMFDEDGALLKLPTGDALATPAATEAPQLVDKIAVLDEAQTASRSDAGSGRPVSHWAIVCSTLGWILVYVYVL